MFLPDMLQAQLVLSVFGDLGKKHLGQLWVHLEEKGVQHSMYVRFLHADTNNKIVAISFSFLYIQWMCAIDCDRQVDFLGILSDT